MTSALDEHGSGTGDGAAADAFAERIFGSILGAIEVQAVFLGDRLGYYRSLADDGPATSVELAERTGTAERYAREWLEQQAATGYLTVDDAGAAPTERRFTLPDAHAPVLADPLSLRYMAPFAVLLASLGKQLDALVDAYRTGGGVSWEQHGRDARESQGAANRPLFLGPLAREYLPSLPALDAALRAGGRVADIGCGLGWSSIGIALGYPEASIDGYDLDTASVEEATRLAEQSGVADRVRFHAVDAATAGLDGTYQLVTAFECLHDMADPVAVLRTMRALAAADGTVLVMDENVDDVFTAPAGDVDRLMYGYSLLGCLPDGLSHPGGVGTGTVMRPATLEAYATEAGFERVEVLPIENDFFRFYRLA